jgi:2,4-dienoyl-CoA reductase-like NADH-dependent reductase (Old Yellow Enzyme family)
LPRDVALFAAGGVQTRAHLEAAYEAGVDVVVVGKAGIRHPDWPVRVREPAFVPAPTPWARADLDAVAVSPRFLAYLQRFPGLVEGGAPARPPAG